MNATITGGLTIFQIDIPLDRKIINSELLPYCKKSYQGAKRIINGKISNNISGNLSNANFIANKISPLPVFDTLLNCSAVSTIKTKTVETEKSITELLYIFYKNI